MMNLWDRIHSLEKFNLESSLFRRNCTSERNLGIPLISHQSQTPLLLFSCRVNRQVSCRSNLLTLSLVLQISLDATPFCYMLTLIQRCSDAAMQLRRLTLKTLFDDGINFIKAKMFLVDSSMVKLLNHTNLIRSMY